MTKSTRRKICVVTGSRAEYGLLYGLLKEIQSSPSLELQLVVTGAHLSTEFGNTQQEIESDGFTIQARVQILSNGSQNAPIDVARATAKGVAGFAEAFEKLQPDLLVILGDRYEIFAAAQAAMIFRIPIAHIHGGETTEGAIDEAIRHSLTKMSHFHFTASDPYSRRIVQMGEDPQSVYNVGALAIDNIKNTTLLNRQVLEESLSFSLGETNILLTYHPVTLSNRSPKESVEQVLKALDAFPGAKVLITQPNADAYGNVIFKVLQDFAKKNNGRVAIFESLGRVRYLSALSQVQLVLGNSSSGMIEAPFFRVPTVNIGERQKGRIRTPSIIDCDEDSAQIEAAIRKGLSKEFVARLSQPTIYGDGTSARKMRQVLEEVSLDRVLFKRFRDLSLGGGNV
jgi:UDP-N-acetylglucosamine 2-epimerase (non-hydrolysing)/GDP/UDP-N,N'-diacetylbacillosamine 2-epimerase (hydrolysing)